MFKYVLVFLLGTSPVLADSAPYVEGQDYQLITQADPTPEPDTGIRVTEFFSYGCPWCYRLEPALTTWLAAREKSLYFSRVPVVFNAQWDYYARACYLITALSLDKTVHEELFKAIVLDKKRMANKQAMLDFFSKHGVDSTVVESTLSHSPSIEIQLKNDALLMAKYQINAVPTLVVNEHYKTNLQMAKTEKRLFEIMDFLIEKVKKERTMSSNARS